MLSLILLFLLPSHCLTQATLIVLIHHIVLLIYISYVLILCIISTCMSMSVSLFCLWWRFCYDRNIRTSNYIVSRLKNNVLSQSSPGFQNLKKKKKKKKMEEKNESAISRQTDSQRKMNARELWNRTFFFCLALRYFSKGLSLYAAPRRVKVILFLMK